MLKRVNLNKLVINVCVLEIPKKHQNSKAPPNNTYKREREEDDSEKKKKSESQNPNI